MTPREAAIHTCKEQIRHAANYAMLNWSEDDLVCVHDDNVGDVVFLRRFNPHEAIGDYYIDGWFADEYEDGTESADDDGDVVMRDGKPVIVWTKALWAEWCNESRSFIVRCIAPWLVRIVTPDGTIIRATDGISSALAEVSLDDDSTCARLHCMAQEASMVRVTDCACQCNASVHSMSRD